MCRILKPGCCLNKLQMNVDKMKVTPLALLELLNLNLFLSLWTSMALSFKFCPSPRNVGVTLDSTVPLHQHVLNICRGAFLELWRINSIHNFLTTDVVMTLVCSLILSHIEYYNSLLAGLLQCLFKKIQYMQNAAAQIFYGHQNLIMSHFFKSFTGYPLAAE